MTLRAHSQLPQLIAKDPLALALGLSAFAFAFGLAFAFSLALLVDRLFLLYPDPLSTCEVLCGIARTLENKSSANTKVQTRQDHANMAVSLKMCAQNRNVGFARSKKMI